MLLDKSNTIKDLSPHLRVCYILRPKFQAIIDAPRDGRVRHPQGISFA